MHHITRRLVPSLIAAAIAAGVVAATLFASSGQAAGGRAETLRIFEKTVSIQLTKADGKVIAKLPIAETEPQAGDVLDVVFNLFTGNHVKHSKKTIGTDHLRCTFVAAGPPTCVSHAALGSSMLVVEGNPGTIVLGTGKYQRAGGRVVSAKEVNDAPPSSLAHNDIDVVARLNLK
jgi:hypothetical protein